MGRLPLPMPPPLRHPCLMRSLLPLVLALTGCLSETQPPIQPAPLATVEPTVPAASAPSPAMTQAGPPQASDANPPEAAVAREPEPEVQPVATPSALEGTIASRAGSTLTLTIQGAPASKVGTHARLFRRFAKKFGSVDITGWLEVADVVIKKADARAVVVEILKEKSDIRVNGKKVDHFAPGETIKIE
jgi:hypothetical protein